VIFAMELCTARTSRTSDRFLLLSIPGGCSSMEADCAVIAGADSRRRCLPLLPLLLLLLLLPMVVYADETANTQRAVGHSSEATCGLKHLSPQLPPRPAPPIHKDLRTGTHLSTECTPCPPLSPPRSFVCAMRRTTSFRRC
jgi:hypothetical protein